VGEGEGRIFKRKGIKNSLLSHGCRRLVPVLTEKNFENMRKGMVERRRKDEESKEKRVGMGLWVRGGGGGRGFNITTTFRMLEAPPSMPPFSGEGNLYTVLGALYLHSPPWRHCSTPQPTWSEIPTCLLTHFFSSFSLEIFCQEE
jgi:hypothetical protein